MTSVVLSWFKQIFKWWEEAVIQHPSWFHVSCYILSTGFVRAADWGQKWWRQCLQKVQRNDRIKRHLYTEVNDQYKWFDMIFAPKNVHFNILYKESYKTLILSYISIYIYLFIYVYRYIYIYVYIKQYDFSPVVLCPQLWFQPQE